MDVNDTQTDETADNMDVDDILMNQKMADNMHINDTNQVTQDAMVFLYSTKTIVIFNAEAFESYCFAALLM
ncbi:uncharacterized protein BJ212DRAFT_1478021 [Suillus subaureus]|uniref:Uncharacterized protein n=1 Tax=Suillus subaureus TaxID=48587 RepID=A0A9P7EGU5_9AGAM|nr:uncharacterized protein BJ212DRAFT_1478021 [Suillus subaureus]KAG1820924.1 hypothetical protein BJ212DRAFT_1478021 [Suillus subaureus]